MDVGVDGGGELAGIVRRDRRGVDPGNALGDKLRLDDHLADLVGAEEGGDDDLGALDGRGGGIGARRALIHEGLRALGGAVPHRQLVLRE